jgi:hypothetical protein
MTEEARGAGFFVLHGACFEAERSIPYAPLLDLVRLFATSGSPALVAHVLAPAASALVSVFPSSGRFFRTQRQARRLIPNWTGDDCFTRSARS